MSAKDEEKKEKILYVQTSGVDSPERLYAPFTLATTAVSTDVEAYLFFVGEGITVVKKGEAEKIQVGDMPPLKELMIEAVEAGVKLLVCEESFGLYGLNRKDIYNKALPVGPITLNDLLLTTDAALSF
ncbi:DsrE family protein [Candidatus Bathyarchaeota archaeon]|nr:DsrE family protein [Candidatus Bathyarchaeota archaeon]